MPPDGFDSDEVENELSLNLVEDGRPHHEALIGVSSCFAFARRGGQPSR